MAGRSDRHQAVALPISKIVVPQLKVQDPLQAELDRIVVPGDVYELLGIHFPAHEVFADTGAGPPLCDTDHRDLADGRRARLPVGVLRSTDEFVVRPHMLVGGPEADPAQSTLPTREQSLLRSEFTSFNL